MFGKSGVGAMLRCLTLVVGLMLARQVAAEPVMQVDLSVSAGDADTQARLHGCMVSELLKIPDLVIGGQRPHFRLSAAAVFDQVELVSVASLSMTLIKPIWMAAEYLDPPVSLEPATHRALLRIAGRKYRDEISGLGHLTSHQLQVVTPEELPQLCVRLIENFNTMTVEPIRAYMRDMQARAHPAPAGGPEIQLAAPAAPATPTAIQPVDEAFVPAMSTMRAPAAAAPEPVAPPAPDLGHQPAALAAPLPNAAALPAPAEPEVMGSQAALAPVRASAADPETSPVAAEAAAFPQEAAAVDASAPAAVE